MYNAFLVEFHEAVTLIARAHTLTAELEKHGTTQIPAKNLIQLYEQFEHLERLFEKLGMENALKRVRWSLKRLTDQTMTGPFLRDDTRAINEAIIDDARELRVFVYAKQKGEVVAQVDEHWAPVFAAFDNTRVDIKAGVDLWAMGHHTACVFHMMRASEIGLRWLAKRMGVTFARKPTEWGQWGELLQALDKKVVDLRGTTAGPKRDAALKFYSEAVGEMRALAERRDAVMHVRRDFDEHEARSTIDRVHALLTGLATKQGRKLP